MKDLQDIVHELKQRGVHLKATEQPVDTSTAAGKAFLDMLGVFAEFETNLRKERQLEGIHVDRRFTDKASGKDTKRQTKNRSAIRSSEFIAATATMRCGFCAKP